LPEEDIAIYVAIAAVLIIAIGIFLSDKRTRDSNELTRYELKHKLRAWLKIKNLVPHMIVVNGVKIGWEEYWRNTTKYKGGTEQVAFRTEIINIGSMPALEVIGSFLSQKGVITRDDVKSAGHTDSFPLLPNDYLPQVFVISNKDFEKSVTEPYYFGAYISYQVDGVKKGIGKIWINDGSVVNEDSWIEE